MEIAGVIAIWLAIVIVSMVAVSYLAVRWGRDPFGWALLSAALGPIAIVALFGTRQSDRAHPAEFDRSRGARPAGSLPCIVAPVDGSAASEAVARYIATAHPHATDIALLAVLPLEMRTRGSEQQNREHEAMVARMSGAAEKVLRGAGLPVRVAVGYGQAGEEIVRFADSENASVIVIGRRGAGLSKALLGSVSDAVVKHAKQPVAIID